MANELHPPSGALGSGTRAKRACGPPGPDHLPHARDRRYPERPSRPAASARDWPRRPPPRGEDMEPGVAGQALVDRAAACARIDDGEQFDVALPQHGAAIGGPTLDRPVRRSAPRLTRARREGNPACPDAVARPSRSGPARPIWSSPFATLTRGPRISRAATQRLGGSSIAPGRDQRMRTNGLAIGPRVGADLRAGKSAAGRRPARTSRPRR